MNHFRIATFTTACLATLLGSILTFDVHGASAQPVRKSDARKAIAAAQAVSPGGIDELKAVQIGGIQQWIHVRGNDSKNPVLLFLHGGPGSPMMAESWTFQRPWEDFFTVVQWDQRGSGKTFSSSRRKVDPSLSIDRMQADAEELIEYLRRSYSQPKIFLLGHSWGSVLGVKVAQHHPEWLYAYIAIGQVVDMRRNEAVGYELTLARAKALHNGPAVKELESIAPYPNADGSIPVSKTQIERKWDIALGGMLWGRDEDNEWQRWALSSEYNDYDVESAKLGEESTVMALWSQLGTVSFDSVTRFECPVFVFTGAQDRTTPTSLAEEFYQRIQAPQKKLFKIERAAHYVFNEAPGEVLVDLVRDVRPLFE